MLGRNLVGDLVPEHVAVAGCVRLRRAREDAPPAGGELECVAQHALHAVPREDARLHRHLACEASVRTPPNPGVLALGVLAHEQHVDVGRRATGERAWHAVEQPRRTHVRPEVEALADLEHDPPQRNVVRHRGIADRAHQDRVVRLERFERIGRHHPAVLVPVRRAPWKLGPLDREAQRVDRLPGLGDHLRPDPVPGQEGDPVCHIATPTRSGTVSTYASASSSETTSAYFAWMSNRFASCGACARSPTHSRGTSVGQPYWSRSIAVARMQPLVVAPQRTTESTSCETRIEARFVPKKADAPFFRTTVSSSRGSSRGSISTQWPPSCRSPSAGTFWSQRPRPSGSARSRSS